MTNTSRPRLGALEDRDPELVDSSPAMREHILKDGAIPAKYKLLMAMITEAIVAHPDGVTARADDARAAGASEAEITEAAEVGYLYGGTAALRPTAPPDNKHGRGHREGSRSEGHPLLDKLKAGTALWGAALIVGAGLLIQTAPPSWADGCGDASGAHVSAGGCADPGGSVQDPPPPVAAPPQGGLGQPPWIGAVEQRDPQFVDSYLAMREHILKDGAIPAKYKLLMGMITDAIAAHPDGVRGLANNARAAGASEAEITEAVEVGYLWGGTAALVMGVNAFTST